MAPHSRIYTCMLALIALGCMLAPAPSIAQDVHAVALTDHAYTAEIGTSSRAAEGETVWLVAYHVHADHREPFEGFVHELWESALAYEEIDPDVARAFRQTRVLFPTGASAEGTYTYFLVMDPVLEGPETAIGRLLRLFHGEEEAERRFAAFRDALAAPHQEWRVTQSAIGAPAGRVAPGREVWIIANHFQPDQRERFEAFTREFWGLGNALGQTDPVVERTFSQTRVLHPTRANEDGTYTYFFLMDPVVDGANYSIAHLLERAASPEDARRLWREFYESRDRDNDGWVLTQSDVGTR
jgi:hypothetical protein